MSDEKQSENQPLEPTTEPILIQESGKPIQPSTEPLYVQATEDGGSDGPIKPETPSTWEQKGSNPDNIETK